jgi:hypothetical protein
MRGTGCSETRGCFIPAIGFVSAAFVSERGEPLGSNVPVGSGGVAPHVVGQGLGKVLVCLVGDGRVSGPEWM